MNSLVLFLSLFFVVVFERLKKSVSTTSGQLLKLTQKGEVSAKAGTNKS